MTRAGIPRPEPRRARQAQKNRYQAVHCAPRPELSTRRPERRKGPSVGRSAGAAGDHTDELPTTEYPTARIARDSVLCGGCAITGRRKVLARITGAGLLLYCRECREPVLLPFAEIERARRDAAPPENAALSGTGAG